MYPDGTTKDFNPKGEIYTLEELRSAIGGGYIEIFDAGENSFIVIDEEGKLKGLPFNSLATMLMAGRLQGGDYIVGDALLCSKDQIE
tara:strand:- start:2305 stop:2565 length:261 start_codon:yes stop_codon:yes gene_type:complete